MSGLSRARLPILLGCLLIAGLAIGGCRKEEQNRILNFEKGTYLGQPDQKLTDEQVRELQQRAGGQRY